MSMTKTRAEDSDEEAGIGTTTGGTTMHLTSEDELPSKVANVSREELRKYVQCKRVGNYLLGKTVGEGSFAKVKEAFHILTGEKVAIKVIDKNRARKDRYVSKNMRREARLLQMIRHPHIVQLLEIVETSQCYYLVFEFADGGDLMDHICKHSKLEEEEVRKFTRQIISAVAYLHSLGIIHRDLKVENLLLDAKKNIKIIDFGLSNTIYSPDPHSENHCSTQCGSPAYAAPELLVRKDYGPQIDVWSIGVNLYAMLTGRLPYTVEPFNISTLYSKMLKKQMNTIPDYLSEGCKDFIHQLLNPNPKERIKILESAKHRWITNNQKDPLVFITCPNYLTEEDLEDRILDHVESQLKLNSDEIIRDVIQNRATKNSCVYHLLVRRLERYKREHEERVAPPVKAQITEDNSRACQDSTQPLTNCIVSSPPQQKGLLSQEQRSSPKLHIMENPFKAIKIALIRQKNAANNTEKSKSTKTPSARISQTTSPNDRAQKPKLCKVKRVALVKFMPARRSLRATSSTSRISLNSPIPGRRIKNHFDGPQRRRKSPRVRRRYAEPEDSLSSVGSVSRLRNSFHSRKPPARRRAENKSNHETASRDKKCSKTVQTDVSSAKSAEERAGKLSAQVTPAAKKEPEEKPMETVTHFYTDKGVVLKRDPAGTSGNTDRKLDATADNDVVQHHVFHSEDATRNVVDRQEPLESNDVRGETAAEVTTAQREADVRVVNVKVVSMPDKSGVERLQPISPKLNTSGTQASTRKTPTKDPPERGFPLKRKQEEKSVTLKWSSSKLLNSSKIPVPAVKISPGRQSPRMPARLAPRTPSLSTASPRSTRRAEARKAEVQMLVDKYTKCFSVVVVDRSAIAKNVGGGVKAGVKDRGRLRAKGEIKEEEKNRETQGERDETDQQKLQGHNNNNSSSSSNNNNNNNNNNSSSSSSSNNNNNNNNSSSSSSSSSNNNNNNNTVETPRPPAEKHQPERVTRVPLTTKDSKTCENTKNTNITRKLPTTVRRNDDRTATARESRAQQQSTKAKESEQTAPWVGNERRKISNYRTASDTPQIKTTYRREIRNATTNNYRSMLRSCSIK